MATIGANLRTLEEHKKLFINNRPVSTVINLLSKSTPMLEDLPFREGNLMTGHRTTMVNGLPDIFWRTYNQGIPASKSRKVTVDEKTGMMEAYSEIDVKLANLGGNQKQSRSEEASLHIEAMGQEAELNYFYGNSGLEPEKITGLTNRYSDLGAANAQNIVDVGGTGTDNTSIWLIVFGEQSFHGIYPKGSMAGIQHKDLGQRTREWFQDNKSMKMEVYTDHFSFDTGVVLKDWRYVARACNIDVSELIDPANNAKPNLINVMIDLQHRIHKFGMGKACYYMNRTVHAALDKNKIKNAVGLEYKDVDGKWVMSFRGIPVRSTDTLLTTEARVR